VTPSVAFRAAAASAAGSRPPRSGASSRNDVRVGGRVPGVAPSVTVPDDVQDAVARHAEAVATVRAFAERSGAQRVVLLVDDGDGPATMLDCAPGGALELTDGTGAWRVPAGTPVEADPRPLPDLRPPPPTALAIDPESGELEAPLGAVANLGRAVLGLASTFGRRSVATADFATRDPALPITIAAREGEPLVLAAGDRRFVLPDVVR
jgi:hypothetical protein